MALLWRVRAQWAGGNIGTGFTNFHFTEGVSTAQAAADSARAFLFSAFGSTQPSLPVGVSISFPGGVDVLDPGSGILLTTLSVTPPANVTGSGAGTYAAPTGACVSWVTSGVVAGHRVKGRTFLVPMSGTAFQSDGTLATSTISDITSAASTFISAPPEFVIWHRPGPVGVGGGSAHPVLGSVIRDRAAVLTSRR